MDQTDANPGSRGRGGIRGPANLYQRLCEDWLSMVQALDYQVPPMAVGREIQNYMRQASQPGGAFIPLILLFGHAYLQCFSSCLRCGGRLAETMSRRQSQILARLQTVDPSSASDQSAILRALADDARGFLREISELSLQEAQLLQEELARLDMALRALASDWPERGEGRARRWKAKP